jgi:hypothetical protein
MKRFLVFAAAVAALSFPALVNAAKPTDAVHGPACGDITLEPNYSYNDPTIPPGSTAPATAAAIIDTAVPSCAKVTYNIYYYDASGSTLLASCSYTGDGVSMHFGPCNYPSQNGDPLCMVGTSVGDDDGHVIDSAPDAGCSAFGEPVSPGPSGASGFN